jgi:S-adenosylmethionine synthetase
MPRHKNITISSTKCCPSEGPIEIIEKKGRGHPDPLCDALAESLSNAFSEYTYSRFGAILRHQFDKTTLMCGKCIVEFGGGALLEPIRVLLNGRASARLGNESIPVRELLTETTYSFFRQNLPLIRPEKEIRIIYEVQTGQNVTTGGIAGDAKADESAIHFRFFPRSLADLPETRQVESNDTSAAVGFAPLTPLETFVIELEHNLNGAEGKLRWPWSGTDIKIMALREGKTVSLTACVPILSAHTKNRKEYFERLDQLRQFIQQRFIEMMPDNILGDLALNPSDDPSESKLYLTLTGSSIEKGDESAVGRGNKTRGVISLLRPFTGEAIAGKNPRANMAKVYSAVACDITDNLHRNHGISSDIFLVNRSRQAMAVPWLVAVRTTVPVPAKTITDEIERCLSDIPAITQRIVKGHYTLF